MISTKKAISIVNESTQPLGTEKISLKNSLNRVLSQDAIAAIDLPPFNQSAMDGYAIKLHDSNKYLAKGEIKAGDDASPIELKTGEAVKIFTGAMTPTNADLVCRIEDITELLNEIVINNMPKTGANIRLKGEQICSGEVGLTSCSQINPAAVGLLANLGISYVSVISSPRINIISTGNELVTPKEFEKLKPGKIYESNGVMLQTALQQHGFKSNDPKHLEDTYSEVLNGVKSSLENSDLLIISGGISVGDYDFVGKVLHELEVEQKFYKVNQKPGKPLYFGKKDDKLIFALPGNPAAALTCFYIYVLPALNKMSGRGFLGLPKLKAKIANDVKRGNAREQFLKGHLDGDRVRLLEGQSSAMLRSFAESNALIYLPANSAPCKNDIVDVIKLF